MLSTADLHFFATVARSASLAAAARELDVTPPAVTQRLQDIERRIGVRLVERSGRRITLTDEGELLATRGQAISDDLAALNELLATRRGVVAGHLRVIAPLGFGRQHVAPLAGRFLDEHTELTLDLTLSDRLGRVPETSWDVAVHIGELRESSLVAQRIAPNERFVVAAPSFIARHGTPETPQELRDFQCIALRENDEDVTLWRFTNSANAVVQLRIEPRLSSNDGDVVRDWALAGLGIIVRSEWSVADDLRAGRLVRLLGDYRLPSADIVAFVGARKGRSARTSRFVAHLRETLNPPPWRSMEHD
jgi:DNA-binding transcriptional LysR family regulator